MRASLLLAFALCLAARAFAAPAPAINGPRSGKWAHETPKALAPDERVMWGRLDNGFRYALLPHKGVPGRVSLQLIVLAGSLDERPDELGIAHYIEHLCFGGSKHFKSEDMVSLFQRLGVEYGSDINANTTFDATTFKLDFRENDPALLREGMLLFRDFGDGVTFSPAIIEQERRVVLAELRNRDTLMDKQQQASMPVVFRGMQFPERMPGGSEQLIANFKREQFLAFYKRNYRPDLMVLVGAGDFDPAAMAKAVRELFGDMARPDEPIPQRDEGRLDARNPRAGIYRIAGLPIASDEIASVFQLPAGPDTREAHVESQKRNFVMEVFSERLRTDITAGEGATADYAELMGCGVSQASVTVAAKDWSEGFRALDEMLRLTLERGLDVSDVETLRRRQLRMTALMADQIPTLDPSIFCDSLVDSIVSHRVYEGFERRFAWMREWLEHFSARDAQQVFRTLWAPNALALHASGGVDLELTPDKMLAELQRHRRNSVSSFVARTHKDTPFTLPKFGAPTTVVEKRSLPALNAQLMRFGNNVRLNFAPSRQEPGLVRAVVRVGSGLLDMPGNKPALKEFALNTLLASGAVHFRPEVMQALVEERLLEFSFDISDRDAFTFRALMGAEQLETFLGLVADILHAPQFNSFVHEDQRFQAFVGRAMSGSGMGDGMRELSDHLFKGDARFTQGQPLDYVSLSILDVRRWMEPALARGYVEATIVGDITEDAAVKTVARTLGALAPRAATKATATKPKPVKITAPPGYTRIEFVGEQNMGLVVATWPITEPMHVRDQAALEVLAKLLEIRVRTELREHQGLAYSPSASFNPYDGFPDFGMVRAEVDCAPNDSKKVAPVVEAIGDKLAQAGVAEGEFIGARGILKTQIRQAFRENGALIGLLMRAQERPEETKEIVDLRGGMMDTITREEVNKWAAKILVKNNCRTAAIVPKAFVGFFNGEN